MRTFASTVAAPITFNGNVNGSGRPARQHHGRGRHDVRGPGQRGLVETNASGTTAINANITTTGAAGQVYNDAVTVSAGVKTLNSTVTAPINFVSTVNGPGGLIITTDGTTTLGGAVGPTLESLTTNGGGTTAINAATVTTTGLQNYADAVTLGVPAVALTSSGNAAISLAAVDGAADLTITTSGLTTLGGVVGPTVTSLTVNGGGTTAINTPTVTTTGLQNYADAVTLGVPAVALTSSGNAAITLARGRWRSGLTISDLRPDDARRSRLVRR